MGSISVLIVEHHAVSDSSNNHRCNGLIKADPINITEAPHHAKERMIEQRTVCTQVDISHLTQKIVWFLGFQVAELSGNLVRALTLRDMVRYNSGKT